MGQVLGEGLERKRHEAVFQHFYLKGNLTEQTAEMVTEPTDDKRTRSILWKI